MAHKVNNSKKFLIIALTPKEAITKCGFGATISQGDKIYNVLIDDNTNELLNEETCVFYICVLNKVFSKKTCKKWLHNAKRYKDDISYEKRYFDYYIDKLA